MLESSVPGWGVGRCKFSEAPNFLSIFAYAHEHSIIHYPAACRRVPYRVPVLRAYMRHAVHAAPRAGGDAERTLRAAPARDPPACQAWAQYVRWGS